MNVRPLGKNHAHSLAGLRALCSVPVDGDWVHEMLGSALMRVQSSPPAASDLVAQLAERTIALQRIGVIGFHHCCHGFPVRDRNRKRPLCNSTCFRSKRIASVVEMRIKTRTAARTASRGPVQRW